MVTVGQLYQRLLGIKWLIFICFILTHCVTQPEVNDVAEITLAGGFYQDSALQFDAQRSVNMYPDVNEVDGGKGVAKLQQIPGLKYVNDFTESAIGGNNKVIGMYSTSDDRMFVVSLGILSLTIVTITEVFEDGSGLNLGNITGPVGEDIDAAKMADNGQTLCVVAGRLSGFVDLTIPTAFGIFIPITDPSYPDNVTDVIFKDTYFIFLAPDEGRFYISSSYATDPVDCIDATEFGTVESSADDLVGLVARTNEILIFGTKTIEPFYNNANVDFPWARNNGGIQDVGTLSRASIATMNNDIYFLGSSKDGYGVVYRMSGYQLQPISTGAIEGKIRESNDLTDAIAYTYQDRGHYFYVITFPSLNTTFCYDASTGIWHERAVLSDQGTYDKYYGRFSAFAWGRNFISDEITAIRVGSTIATLYGVVLEYDPTLYHNILVRGSIGEILREEVIPLERTLTHQMAENKNVIYNKFEVDVQKGVGLVTGIENDINPVIELSMSRDGGMTWGEPMQMTIGKLGEYSRRARKKRLGKSRDTVFKLYSTSAVQMEWFKAYVEYEVLGD